MTAHDSMEVMEEMLERATDPSKDGIDEVAVHLFCQVVRKHEHLMEKAHKKLLTKIHSNNVTEAMRAIALLEEAMAQCGPEFQDEVAKFRFLNEFIRLVSKNYQGGITPVAVKKRLMECLLLWTTLYPQKTKIRDVYDMLKKEETVDHGPSNVSVLHKKSSILGEDSVLFEKLIQSGDQENFKRANLLLKARLNQEARRNEFLSQHKSQLQQVQNTVALLAQMLDTYVQDGCVDANAGETINLMRELFMACKKHKSSLQRLNELIEDMSPELLVESLEINDALLNVLARYKEVIVHPKEVVKEPIATRSPLLAEPKTNTDLLTELLSNTDFPTDNNNTKSDVLNANGTSALFTNRTSTLDEISDIFGPQTRAAGQIELITNNSNDLIGQMDILEPINVLTAAKIAKADVPIVNRVDEAPEKRPFRDLKGIDAISQELLKENLCNVERIGSFQKKNEKLTLNDLAMEKMKKFSEPSSPAATNPIAEAITKVSSAAKSPVDDEQILSHNSTYGQQEDDVMLVREKETPPPKKPDAAQIEKTNVPVLHLSDINIDLDDIAPTSDERVLLNDDDIKVTLNFTENHPSRHVSVIVLSVLNKSKLSVKNFQFEASAKKPSKVRLLPPSDSSMQPYKPFRPPTPINQVMLLLNPTGKSVDVTCIIGYQLGDDPDPIKESVIAKDIPYVE